MPTIILNRFTQVYRISEDPTPMVDESVLCTINTVEKLGDHIIHETISNLEQAGYKRYDLPTGYTLVPATELANLVKGYRLVTDNKDKFSWEK